MVEKTHKTFQIKPKLAILWDKLNPYKRVVYDENNKPIIPKKVVLYRKLVTWLVDVVLNGAIISFVSWSFLIQKSYLTINCLAIFTWGLAIFLMGKLLGIFWKKIIDGLCKVASSLRFVK